MNEQGNAGRAKVQPKVWMGIVWFAIVMVVFVFVAAPIQYALGMWGVAITEIILLLMAVLPAIILKWDIKKVIPIRLPKLRQIFGTLLIWGGTYLIVIVSTMAIAYFFPEEVFSVSSGIGSLFNSVPPLISFFIVAIMPAICEETLHRGLILYTFKNVKQKWVIVIAMGIIFGVFHLDPVRSIPTGILGAAITYIMLETNNILLPMLLHFVNNAMSSLANMSNVGANLDAETVGEVAEQISGSTMTLGVYCVMAVAAPVLLLLGAALINGNRNIPRVIDTDDTTEVLVDGIALTGSIQEERDARAVNAQTEATPGMNTESIGENDTQLNAGTKEGYGTQGNINPAVPNRFGNTKSDKFLTGKRIVIALTCSAALFITGIALVINGMKSVNLYEIYKSAGMEDLYYQLMGDAAEQFNISEKKTITEDTISEYKVGVIKDGNYTIEIELTGKNENCRCGVELLDASGKRVYYSGEAGLWLTVQAPIQLKKGDYTLRFVYFCPAENEDTFQVKTVVK